MSDIETATESSSNVKRGRGRPKKELTNNGSASESAINNGTNNLPKKRGRKPAAAAPAPKSAPPRKQARKSGAGRPAKTGAKAGGAGAKRRGRPRKSVESPAEEEVGGDDSASASNDDD